MSKTKISPDAKIAYRGITRSPPARLDVGAYSIFEGSIVAERPGTSVSIGTRTFIGASQLICAERIEIGDDVLISWGCTIIDHHSHATNWEDRSSDVMEYYHGQKDWSGVKIAPIIIGNKAWIGFNSIILAGVTIGEGAVVGCASVVTKDVPPYAVVAGSPARIVKADSRNG